MTKKISDKPSFTVRLREWLKSSWWITFSASLVATVLGIALTFGIGQHSDSVKQKKFLRTIKLVAMVSIRKEIKSTEYVYEGLLKPANEAMKEATKFSTLDSLRYLDEDVARSLADVLLTKYANSDFHYTESLVRGNAELWKYERNYSEIDMINTLFHYVFRLHTGISIFNEEVEWIREKHFDEILSMYQGEDPLNGFQTLLQDNKALFSCVNLALNIVEIFEEDMKNVKWRYEKVMEQLGFTEEDLDAYEKDIRRK